MAIVNRSLDASEQRKTFNFKWNAVVGTGATVVVGAVPYPSVIEGAQMAAYGLSGSPTWTLKIHRFIVGTGATYFAVSGAMSPSAFGTSGVQAAGLSLLASGNTLLNLLPNDVLMVETAGANSAVLSGALSVVLRPIQDIKANFALSSGV